MGNYYTLEAMGLRLTKVTAIISLSATELGCAGFAKNIFRFKAK
jgi:hypothetical protein